jgi:hypothetical protein
VLYWDNDEERNARVERVLAALQRDTAAIKHASSGDPALKRGARRGLVGLDGCRPLRGGFLTALDTDRSKP